MAQIVKICTTILCPFGAVQLQTECFTVCNSSFTVFYSGKLTKPQVRHWPEKGYILADLLAFGVNHRLHLSVDPGHHLGL